MKRRLAEDGLFYLAAAAMAWALKAAYSCAGSAELQWILRPTAALVSLATGVRFLFEEGGGSVSTDGGTLIAPACAGINFLIICFCMLTFAQMHRFRGPGKKTAWLLGAFPLAYSLALLVNATRIVVLMRIASIGPLYGWLSHETVHRLVGIAVYFLSLSLLYCTVERTLDRCAHKQNLKPHTRMGRALLRIPLVIPLFWYLLITLGIPLLRASHRTDPGRFVEHACCVLLLPVLIVFGLSTARWCWRCCLAGSRKKRLALALPCLLVPTLLFLGWDVRPTTNLRFDKRCNGLWIGQKWYAGHDTPSGRPVSEGELDALIATLNENGIRYVYVRAGKLTPSGTLGRMPGPAFFSLKRRAPDVMFLPWISGEAGQLPLHDPEWRECVMQTMGRLQACGVPGVHLDIEPIRDRQQGYRELLAEIRNRFDGAFFLSHATRRVAPFGLRGGPISRHFWSRNFYRETMRVSDQTVLMGYNTLLDSPRLYRAYMRHQTALLLDWAAAIPGHHVLVGIPSYDNVPALSNPDVENVQNALLGVRTALEQRPTVAACFQGVSIYANWATDPQEWRRFRAGWLQSRSIGATDSSTL